MAKSNFPWKKKSKSSLLALEPRMLFDGAAAATPPDSAPAPAPTPEALPEAQLATPSAESASLGAETIDSGMLNTDPAVKTSTQLELVLDPADVVTADLEASQSEITDDGDTAAESLAKETDSVLEIQPAGFIALDVQGDQKMNLAALTAESSLIKLLRSDNWTEQLYALFPGDQGGMTQAWIEAAASFRQGVLDGGLTINVQMRGSSDILGVNGAYAAVGLEGTPVIFINRDLVNAGEQNYANSVLMEEVGHWIDHQINGAVDSQGDEGERFSAFMLDKQISEFEAQRIATENDKIILSIDGQAVEVEMASLLFSGQSYFLKDPGTAGLEQNVLVLGKALGADVGGTYVTAVKTLFVSDPESMVTYSGNNVRGYLYAIDTNNNVIGTYYGEVSRLVKDGSKAEAAQFYVYPSGTITNQVSTTILLDFFSATFNFSSGQTVKTSSDPVATALNALLPKNVAPSAVADNGAATMPNCVTSTGETVATGNVITDASTGDTDSNITYKIENNKLVEKKDTLSVTGIKSTGTSASAIVTAGTTSSNGAAVLGTYGTLTIGADGSYSFNINETNPTLIALQVGQSVNETFTYTIVDSSGLSASALLTITINGGNEKPVAANDYQLLNEGAINSSLVTTTTTVGGLLLNDKDSDSGDALSITKAEKADSISDETFSNPTAVTTNGISSQSRTIDFTYNRVETGQSFGSSLSSTGVKLYVLRAGTWIDTGLFAISTGVNKVLELRTTSTGAEKGYFDFKVNDQISLLPTGGSAQTIAAVDVASQTKFVLTGTGAVPVAGVAVTGEGVQANTIVSSVSTLGQSTYVTLDKAVSVSVIESATLLDPGDTLSFNTGAIYGNYGYLNLKSDGSYSYIQTADIPSNTTVNEYFTYEITDSKGCVDTAVLHIQIEGNKVSPPNAAADNISVIESGVTTSVNTVTGAILSNDTTTTGTTLKITSVWPEGVILPFLRGF